MRLLADETLWTPMEEIPGIPSSDRRRARLTSYGGTIIALAMGTLFAITIVSQCAPR